MVRQFERHLHHRQIVVLGRGHGATRPDSLGRLGHNRLVGSSTGSDWFWAMAGDQITNYVNDEEYLTLSGASAKGGAVVGSG